VNEFIFHWNALLHYASSARRLAIEISSLK
jgi:hypothetical protein